MRAKLGPWQLWVVGLYLVMSLSRGFLGGRSFPFSDYPMFAYIRTDLSAYALVCNTEFGDAYLLDYDLTEPFTRLHVQQQIRDYVHELIPTFNWLDFIVQRLKRRQANCVTVSAHLIEFEVLESGKLGPGWTSIRKIYEQKL